MLTTILPQIIIACTATAAAAYLATAKRNAPLTRKDANILWKLHKQTSTCKSPKMQPLTLKNGKITGFQCQCGYCYTQKRPLLSRTPTNSAHPCPKSVRWNGNSTRRTPTLTKP